MEGTTGQSVPGPSPSAPFLSVIVTAYRRKTFLVGAVRSVLAGADGVASFEIVVVKDFADPEIDRELGGLGPMVRVLTIDRPNIGDSLAVGIGAARGEVLTFLEDDDRYLPEKLRSVSSQFAADPRLGFLRNAYVPIDADGQPAPTWERFRPTPETGRTFDPTHPAREDLRWIFAFSPNLNVTAMAMRADVIRPWLTELATVTAALDSFLFTAALLSDRPVRATNERLTEYRVHSSLSHSAISDSTGDLDLRDTSRSLPTAETMRGMTSSRPGHPLAARFVRAFQSEVRVHVFLLDRTAHLTFGEWWEFLGSALARRQKYLLGAGAYCLYRWVAPERAVRAYRTRRARTLRSAAGSARP